MMKYHKRENEARLIPELEAMLTDSNSMDLDSPAEEGGEEQFLGSLPVIWDWLTNCRIEDRTKLSPKEHRIRSRDPATVYALVLHQMAFSRGNDPNRYNRVKSHFAILPDGKILQLHPISAYLYASNGFNKKSVAVEFAGNFPSTRGRCWKAEKYGCHQLTQAQIRSGRCLIQYLIRKIGLTHVLAHRQASKSRANCPGPDIWYNVGQWAIDRLGLKDGGPGFKIGTGKPITEAWRSGKS
ncbi:peptidoglycan recognition protein family protein [Microbulbifer sp. 2201CG32-9]|uniref:peptidoglycan recognition protein family protein n=1 Tax=Microbulbifer sp. 2201CG32-9 TaxID=3232309 RepID=UPI00345C18F4